MHRLTFDMRPMDEPVFCRSCSFIGTIEHWEPEPGNSVTLSSGSVRVLAFITESKNRRYKGKVIGFENWDELEYQGVIVDGEIEFGYEHLFSCSR